MWNWIKHLDRILRGEATRMAELRDEDIKIPAAGLSVIIFLLAMIYGACMGCFAVFRPDGPAYMQLLASTVKLPALFFLTLVVTFPSLYVFNALVGSRLSLPAVLRLLIASLAVNLAVLASLGPILAFFSLSTTSYPFMVLFNVLLCAASGALGLVFLLQTLNQLTLAARAGLPPPPGEPSQPDQGQPLEVHVIEEPSALERLPSHVFGRQVKAVFCCWMVIFGLVGAQMGWVLRPFIAHGGEVRVVSCAGVELLRGDLPRHPELVLLMRPLGLPSRDPPHRPSR